MNIKLLIEGGDMKPGPAIAQKLGPLGINMGKVISGVNQATANFKGMKVPVELEINEKTKEFSIKTSSPPTSELLKKELSIESGSGDHKKLKVGNASIEDVIKVAKIKFPYMLEKEFKSAVKSILGTCASIGILVENENANAVVKKIEQGAFEKEIEGQISESSAEKRKKLKQAFDDLKKSQEEAIKKEQTAEEEKKKEQEADAKPVAAAAAKPGAAKPGAAKPAAAAKSGDKKEAKKEAKKA
jgi:large subunit ribosomal protein L11